MVTQSDEDQPVGDLSDHVFDGGTMLGVRILRDPDPAAHAERLAQELSGEVVLDVEHAEQAFNARAEAGRAEPVVLSESERAELTARIMAAESGQGPRPTRARSPRSGDSPRTWP